MDDAAKLRADGYEWIFIDTVPAMMEHIERAIEAADFVLIPTRVSAFHLVATRDVVGFCRLHKKPYAFVLNATDPKWKRGIQSAIAQLKKLGPVVPKKLPPTHSLCVCPDCREDRPRGSGRERGEGRRR